MKILFVTTASITAEAFLLELALSLKRQGVNVEFAFSYNNFSDAKSSVKNINDLGFVSHNIPFSRDISFLNDILAFYKIIKLFKSRKYDIIHSHTSKAGFISRLASISVKKSFFIHTSHDFYFREFSKGFKRNVFIYLERIAALFCDKLFFVSNEVYKDALLNKICSEDKCVFVSNGIPTSINYNKKYDLKRSLSLSNETIVIGTVARLVKNKGLNIFLETANYLLSEKKNYFFIICGTGPEKDHLCTLIKNYNLSDSVYFFDFFENKEDLYQVFLNFDYFLFPTLREGLGLVILESLFLNVPVITTNLAPMNEIIKHNYNGLLAEAGDSISFANCIKQLLKDKKFRELIIKNGHQTVLDKYDLNQVNANIISLYNKYLN